jgi:hypothetical protein
MIESLAFGRTAATRGVLATALRSVVKLATMDLRGVLSNSPDELKRIL